MTTLSALLDHSDQLSAQIEFCDQMATKFAPHDRDVSQMYQSIANSLRRLENPSLLSSQSVPRDSYSNQPKPDPTAINQDRS